MVPASCSFPRNIYLCDLSRSEHILLPCSFCYILLLKWENGYFFSTTLPPLLSMTSFPSLKANKQKSKSKNGTSMVKVCTFQEAHLLLLDLFLNPLWGHFMGLEEGNGAGSIWVQNVPIVIPHDQIQPQHSGNKGVVSCFSSPAHSFLKNLHGGTTLVVQWLRICLPMQGSRVWSLVWADST